MKFNWKANWEILLVLVIIVIGIAITTIAAIRNKGGGPQSEPSLINDNNLGEYPESDAAAASTRRPQGNLHQSKSARHMTSTATANSANNARDLTKPTSGRPEGRQSKFDENINNGGAPTVVGSVVNESYDTSSTEPTPSQVLSEPNPIAHQRSPGSGGSQSNRQQQQFVSNSRRQLGAKQNGAQSGGEDGHYVEALGESVDLIDDIHTTRSSLAANEQSLSSNNPQLDQMGNRITPSMTLQAPYGSTPQPLNHLGQLLVNSAGSNKNLEPSGALLDSDDLMMSFNRPPSSNGSSLNDAMLREYNLAANSFNGNNSLQDSVSDSANVFGQTPGGSTNQHRAFSASLPISFLLSDLIRLTRTQGNQNNDQQQQPNRVPQTSILQQLRALPGPLMALLHGTSGSSSNGQQSNNILDFGGPLNHDASESSEHYHRVSAAPTDIHSIINRSLRSSGILPAFPPPKGTPQVWIPPTSGGSYNPAMNNNADFVASNSAGFLRANQQQQHEQGSAFQNQLQGTDQNHQLSQSVGNEVTFFLQQMPSESNQPPPQQQNFMNNPNSYQPPQMQQKQDYSSNNFANTQSNAVASAQNQVHQPGLIGAQMLTMKPKNAQQQPQINQANSAQAQRSFIINRPPQPSEIHVPLGYSPQRQQSQSLMFQMQQPQQLNQNPFDYNPTQVESAPKVTVVNSKTPMTLQASNNQALQANRQNSQQMQLHKAHTRRKRAAISREEVKKQGNRYSHNGIDDDYVDYMDSRPISVVHPDGRPMTNVRLRGFQPALDDSMEESEYHRHREEHDSRSGAMVHGKDSNSERAHKRKESNRDIQSYNEKKAHSTPKKYRKSSSSHPDENSENISYNHQRGQRRGRQEKRRKMKPSAIKEPKGIVLDTAGSGLMSKLLGTASTNDETEEDIDDDDDSASEKRREEMDDAEFGISNDDRKLSNDGSSQDQSNAAPEAKSSGERSERAGSNVNEAHNTRRNQQRSDIDFYGHPGEETRQLKYGILGSGNYEVVNGGIYPEADESTAAVNSVANYVRKPGLLLGGFPKLMGAGEQSMGHQAAFMPGGRVGGFLRGASAHPDEQIDLMSPHSSEPSDLGDKGEVMQNPILEFIDPNGQMFDPNLLTQLGGSGSSALTQHISKDDKDDLLDRKNTAAQHQRGRKMLLNKYNKDQQTSHGKKSPFKSTPSDQQEVLESHYSGESSKQGSNQFNSYQISPSKKVTIFSDQDLDSAPSDLPSIIVAPTFGTRIDRFPRAVAA